MPGTDLMPTGAMETFTGANGATPNTTNIVLALNQGSGGGITIQSNQCRIRTGTASGNRTSIRIGSLSVSNSETEFTWTVAATSVLFAYAIIRSNSLIDAGHGYLVSLKPNDMEVIRHNPTTTYSGPSLVTYTHGFTAGQVVRTRIALFGTTIYARTWLASSSEPTSTWQIQYSDAVGGFTTAGSIGITAAAASAGSKDFFIDNLDVHDTITPTQATLTATGAITPGGVLGKRPNKRFAGAITPAGALTKIRAVARTFTGAITPTGALQRAFPKTFAGTITPAGVLVRRPSKRFAGALTPAAALRRIPGRRFAGAIAPTGAGAVLFIGRIFGAPGQAIMRMVQAAEVRIRHRKG